MFMLTIQFVFNKVKNLPTIKTKNNPRTRSMFNFFHCNPDFIEEKTISRLKKNISVASLRNNITSRKSL